MYHRSCEVLAYIIDGVFLLSLITGIVVCNLLIGMNYTYENIESIQRNFALTPIFELSIEEQCAGTKKAAELDIWPGTVQGCQSIKNHLFTKDKLETLDILVILNRRSVTDHKPDNFEECGTGWYVLTFGWR